MNAVVPIQKSNSLVTRMAERFGVDADKMLTTLKATAFKQQGDQAVSNEQMMALLVVADQYHLNPWTKEIYAFPDKKNGIVPVVSVDGWSRIINENAQLDGIEFRYSETVVPAGTFKGQAMQSLEWIEAVISRKDRSVPIVAREYFEEVYRPPYEGKGSNGPYTVNGPWQSHPRRMLRHKALIQCARIAFGFGGIYDQDEAERIIDVEPISVTSTRVDPRGDLSEVPNEMVQEHFSAIVDLLNQSDKEEHEVAQDCRDYVEANLQRFNELYICVCDKLAREKIISKAKWRKLLETFPNQLDRGETHTA